jgi:cobalt/nickel transport system permease protein
MILAILLGPHAAFLAIASVLIVQAFFFGDGGLLALGCNIFNLGFFPCMIAYPLIYRRITGEHPTRGKILTGSLVAAIVGLQLGAFSVVLETVASGISELPFSTFVMLMQPIHLAIGIVEGLVTAAVVMFVWRARPEIVTAAHRNEPVGRVPVAKVLVGLLVVTVAVGGALSWFASANPDGLEWAMFRTAGVEELENDHGIHEAMSGIQEKTAFLPDYGFKAGEADEAAPAESAWPAVDPGTSVSGVVGGALTLLLIALVGLVLRRRSQPAFEKS